MTREQERPRGRVLVVEDDRSARTIVAEGLRQGGFHVVTAATGEDALEICTREHIDLAVLDYGLPRKTGLEVAEALRQEYGIPFLFLTANDDCSIARAAVSAGAHGYLHKPVHTADLPTPTAPPFSPSAPAPHPAPRRAERGSPHGPAPTPRRGANAATRCTAGR